MVAMVPNFMVEKCAETRWIRNTFWGDYEVWCVMAIPCQASRWILKPLGLRTYMRTKEGANQAKDRRVQSPGHLQRWD